jgi:hypothetical protein
MSGKSHRIEVMDDAMAEVLREKSGMERLAISWRMWSSARDMLRTHLREIHPDWTAEEIQRETARRMSHGVV